jgi:uncharacterized protein YutE (UPF0331/DUF86 family)
MSMELDQDKIKERVSEIQECLGEIERLVSVSEENFWSKKENIAAVKYYFLQAIESVGGICVHIAAKKYNKGVSYFGECFEVLEAEGFLEKKLAEELRKMVKFRNKLIHRYWEINDKNILEYAKSDLNDFNDFINAISKLFR